VLLFFLVAFGIATPAFLAITPNTPAISSFALLMTGSYAPAIAAMVTLRLQGSPGERLEFKERLLRWRVDPSWYTIAVILPSGAWLIAFTHCVIAGTYVGYGGSPLNRGWSGNWMFCAAAPHKTSNSRVLHGIR
jgi:hypothetical protein